ncbi:MAG TPA: hypothetical protein VGP94_14425 [Tepidisphaeraceae bacterium]|jgi:hypothetical protein|nr:hypothetical protein [Tepidisphaeraceae bacterium]
MPSVKKRKLSFADHFEHMTDAQKTAFARQYDREIPLSETRPLTAAEQRLFRRIMNRGRGRPRIGKGASRINITIEKNLLSRVNAFAKKTKISRARMIAQGLELMMKKAG